MNTLVTTWARKEGKVKRKEERKGDGGKGRRGKKEEDRKGPGVVE